MHRRIYTSAVIRTLPSVLLSLCTSSSRFLMYLESRRSLNCCIFPQESVEGLPSGLSSSKGKIRQNGQAKNLTHVSTSVVRACRFERFAARACRPICCITVACQSSVWSKLRTQQHGITNSHLTEHGMPIMSQSCFFHL